ncbi:hypothetical protein JCM6882_006496 [Rhodosporidiobolus microsporus]
MNNFVKAFYIDRPVPVTLDLKPSNTCGEVHAILREKLECPPDDDSFRSILFCDGEEVDEEKTLEESGIFLTPQTKWALLPPEPET